MRAQPATERRAYLQSLYLPEPIERAVAASAGIPRKRHEEAPEPWTQAEFEAQTEWFFGLPRHVQEEASRRAELLWQFEDMALPEGMGKAEAALIFAQRHDIARATLYNWRRMAQHLPREQWPYALVPQRRPGNCGTRRKSEIDPQIWHFIRQSWLTQSQPALQPIYRRAAEMAASRGVPIPSCKTVARRLAELPRPVKVLAREGHEALDAMYPPQRRDYTSLNVHQIWNADGRMADVHVRWPDGSVSRPIVVAWLELRTRTVLGYAIGQSESAHLVRQALAASLKRSRAIPRQAYLDNGRAFASKELTGGQDTRYRFKVTPDEMQGTLTLMGTQVIWAKPYNGKAKPIESFWRTLAEAEKRPEFVGAYCGNKPDNRPEEHDMRNAVDLALYESVLREEIEAYHARAHRGDGMQGRAPQQVYEALMADAVVQRPTAAQIRRCTQAMQQVTINRSGEVSILDNRYGSDESAALPRGTYTACYDPNDATVPIELWDGAAQVATLPLIAKTGFVDREAAQTHAREMTKRKRAAKEALQATLAMDRAADWTTPRPIQAAPGAPLPSANVPGLVHLGKPKRPNGDAAAATDSGDLTIEQYRAARDRGQAQLEQAMQEHEPRRAAGGM